VFVTPPNPPTTLFETPGSKSNQSLFFNLDNSKSIPQEFAREPLSQAEKLRLWRHDALLQHHYKTAEFIGDKVLELTNDPNDAFWLAQVYFNNGDYLRAKHLLTSNPKFEKNVICKYLAGYCLIKLEQWDDALDLIGESNPFTKDDKYQVINSDGGIKLEASMCYLRGLIYANQNNFEKAKKSYKEALLVDVKCYEAFDELIYSNLMTPTEEWEFVTSLNYRNADDNEEFVRMLYTSKLSKYLNVNKFEEAETILAEEYDLGENNDLLLSKSDYYYIQCNFDECLLICEKILNQDKYNFNVIPNYLSCLYELGGKNKLFLMAHQLAEHHPTNPITWLAIGIYYLAINKVVEARKFFSKATLLNPNFGQAWIGFAHTFAAEGEHEQAISAYAYASKLFPGTHLPNLFLGMQYLQMNNLNLAEEYLSASYQICNTDPLLLNELGVTNFHQNNLMKAEVYLQEALAAAKHLNSDSKTWISIHCNLGHVYRRGRQPYKALECFYQVIKISNKNDANILSAIGLIHLKLGNCYKAIDILHDALAIAPSDAIAQDLLKRALEINNENGSLFFNTSDKLFELNIPTLQQRKQQDKLENKHKKLMTPLRTNNIDDESDLDVIVKGLQQGEESSEEDEVMDIESD
jgi:anaphase-promoting complex subunit 6